MKERFSILLQMDCLIIRVLHLLHSFWFDLVRGGERRENGKTKGN